MRTLVAAAGAAAALAGCAAPVYDGRYAQNEGWREGRVEKVAAASELGSRHSYDCRYRNSGLGKDAPGRFAVVVIESMGRHRHHVVPVVTGKEPRVGDEVLTNYLGCEPPVARAR